MRVRIFVDFWNLQIAWNRFHRKRSSVTVPIPWEQKFPDVLTRKADSEGIYHGCHVYASVDPLSPKDEGLRRFLHAMRGFTGYRVTVKDRKARGAYKCPKCQADQRICTTCGGEIRRTVEKGVDTALVTDLIQAAVVDDLLDIAVLVSADADFVPAVELIQNRTAKRVVHAHIRPQGQQLRNACWSHIFLNDIMADLVSPQQL